MGDAGAEAGAAMCVGAAGRRDIMRQEMFWNPVLISTDLDRVLATFLCRFFIDLWPFSAIPQQFLAGTRPRGRLSRYFYPELGLFLTCFTGFLGAGIENTIREFSGTPLLACTSAIPSTWDH